MKIVGEAEAEVEAEAGAESEAEVETEQVEEVLCYLLKGGAVASAGSSSSWQQLEVGTPFPPAGGPASC